jgi:diadenosine tetraphosphatase ApaH/serine/threonine PP2A family protein phosphatase
MKRFAFIGDVHGCVDELEELVERLDDKNTQFIFVGDLIGKGPHSNRVVDKVRQINGLCVLGNHDHLLLAQAYKKNLIRKIPNFQCAEKQLKKAPEKYIELLDEISVENLEWLSSLPFYLKFNEFNIIVVHAGIDSRLELDHQDPYMMVHARDISDDKSLQETCCLNKPWAASWNGPSTVIFGHDAARKLQQYPFAIGLDTGCCYGGKLTAYLFPDRKFISVEARKIYKNTEGGL